MSLLEASIIQPIAYTDQDFYPNGELLPRVLAGHLPELAVTVVQTIREMGIDLASVLLAAYDPTRPKSTAGDSYVPYAMDDEIINLENTLARDEISKMEFDRQMAYFLERKRAGARNNEYRFFFAPPSNLKKMDPYEPTSLEYTNPLKYLSNPNTSVLGVFDAETVERVASVCIRAEDMVMADMPLRKIGETAVAVLHPFFEIVTHQIISTPKRANKNV